jgi:adenine C2-methylase RlmN of 23S rRNA A2503 and tRNA A37
MNKILVEVSVGELLDKISILEIKKEKILDSESLNFIEKEYLILKEQLDKNIIYDEKLDKLFKSLKKINTTLWEYEDEKRSYEKNSDFSDKFIKVARDIHFLNDDRSKVKLEINKITGSLIREIKQYTSY